MEAEEAYDMVAGGKQKCGLGANVDRKLRRVSVVRLRIRLGQNR